MKKISNPPNPFHSAEREWLEPPPKAQVTVYQDASRTILSRNDSPDVGMKWSVNPYRGCFTRARIVTPGGIMSIGIGARERILKPSWPLKKTPRRFCGKNF